MIYYGSKLSDNITETPEGYLICHDTIIARTGMQEYGANEVPIETDRGVVPVYRMVEDVLSKETLASFEGKPITAGHPEDFVTPDNWNDLAMGFVKNVRGVHDESDTDLHYIIADVMIMNAKAIQAVKDGLRELSCGYEADYVDNGDGTGKQTGILGNHVALVPQGRCGSACAIKDESLKGGIMTIKEKLLNAISKVFDAEVIGEEEKEMEEQKDAEVEAPAEEKKEAMTIKALSDKLDALSAKIEQLIGMEEAEAEMEDAKESEEGTEDKCDEEKTADADTISRAEILAPGIAKTGDVQTKAMEAFALTEDGKEVLKTLSALTGDALFVAAVEVIKAKRSATFQHQYNDHVNDNKTVTADDLNKKYAAHWANQK